MVFKLIAPSLKHLASNYWSRDVSSMFCLSHGATHWKVQLNSPIKSLAILTNIWPLNYRKLLYYVGTRSGRYRKSTPSLFATQSLASSPLCGNWWPLSLSIVAISWGRAMAWGNYGTYKKMFSGWRFIKCTVTYVYIYVCTHYIYIYMYTLYIYVHIFIYIHIFMYIYT